MGQIKLFLVISGVAVGLFSIIMIFVFRKQKKDILEKREEEKREEEKWQKERLERERLEEEIRKEKEVSNKKRIEKLKLVKDSFIKELDKDGNGIIDVIESSDFMKLLKKHQKVISNYDKEHKNSFTEKFIDISSYLELNKKNIQKIFESLKENEPTIISESVKGITREYYLSLSNLKLQQYKIVKDITGLGLKEAKELVDSGNDTNLTFPGDKGPDMGTEAMINVLKNQIHTFELLVFHSLNMINALVNEDMITFWEIYKAFDKLNIFNSNWQNEVSQKLSDIGDGLNNLMYTIQEVGEKIVNEIGNLSYVTQEGFSELSASLSKDLQSIDSSLQANNLLTGIQTYQMYKINKQTKSLNN